MENVPSNDRVAYHPACANQQGVARPEHLAADADPQGGQRVPQRGGDTGESLWQLQRRHGADGATDQAHQE